MPLDWIDELRIMNAWNIEGRYQDYKDRFKQICTKEYTLQKMELADQIRKWLINKLQ
jgi:hypothetical protein